MNFKVGDKVKVVNFPDRSIIGMVGTILDISSSNSRYAYSMRVNGRLVAVLESEIEPVLKRGEQLLLWGE